MKKIKIGSQIWAAENMAVTFDRNGEELILEKDYFYPENNPELVEKYGLLYTWDAAMRIAPDGWHLPTDDEWEELVNYCTGVYSEKMVAKSLASNKEWKCTNIMDAIGNGLDANNGTGFSALPAGCNYQRSYYCVTYNTFFWTSTPIDDCYAYSRNLYYGYGNVSRLESYKQSAFSLRLLSEK